MTAIRLGSALSLLVAISVLTGCAPDTPSADSSSPAPSPSSTEPQAPEEPSPSPTIEAEPAAATCENLIPPDTLASIIADGFGLEAPGYVDKIRAEGSPYVYFVDYGGVLCAVNNGTRISELYAYSPISPEDQAFQESRIAADGWVQSSVDGGTLYVDPVEQEGVLFAYYFRNGFWWGGYDAATVAVIVANSPAS